MNTLKVPARNLQIPCKRGSGSRTAQMIIENWEAQLPQFVKVIPVDYRKVLERMKMNENRDDETLSVTEEVYDG